jgi:hypothetical protein
VNRLNRMMKGKMKKKKLMKYRKKSDITGTVFIQPPFLPRLFSVVKIKLPSRY